MTAFVIFLALAIISVGAVEAFGIEKHPQSTNHEAILKAKEEATSSDCESNCA